MQLDSTAIAVRERTMLDVLDLTLHVTRRYFFRLLPLLLTGVAPFALLNYWALGHLVQLDPRDFRPDEVLGQRAYYLWMLALATLLQAPLATQFMTAFLGRAVFREQPRYRAVLAETAEAGGRLLWCVGVLRGALIATALLVALGPISDSQAIPLNGLLFFMAIIFGLVRAVRPYLNEIILLEKNPLVAKPGATSISARNVSLHASGAGTLFALSMASAMIAVLLAGTIFESLVFLQGVLINRWQLTSVLLLYGAPLAMWTTVGLMTVFRFLCYLDLRIRQEGWAVELRMRAEAAKLRDDLGLNLGP